MTFRRNRDDERREVIMPLLWFPRTQYRAPVPPRDPKTSPTGGPARAPASWPIELGLLAAEVATETILRRSRGWRLAAAAAGVVVPFAVVVPKLREAAERHRVAARDGVVHERFREVVGLAEAGEIDF